MEPTTLKEAYALIKPAQRIVKEIASDNWILEEVEFFISVCRDIAEDEFFLNPEDPREVISPETRQNAQDYFAVGFDAESVILCFKSPSEQALIDRITQELLPVNPRMGKKFAKALPPLPVPELPI